MNASAGPDAGTAAPTARAPQQRPRGSRSALDMVRSLAVVGAVVAALVLLVPQSDGPGPQPVDVAGLAETSAGQVDFDLPVPQVPEDWTATSVRLRAEGPDSTPTWHVGYLTPSQGYAALGVARDATPGWVSDRTSDGEPDADAGGTVDVRGVPWALLRSDSPRRTSLLRETDGVTTVVTGSAPVEELVLLAELAGG